jgi:release factor glutamine methyltransferase
MTADLLTNLRSARDRLTPVAGNLALAEAELILQHVLNCARSDLYLSPARKTSEREDARIEDFIRRRLTGEPLPYVLGVAYFHSLGIVVTPEVLIPRPETEILVETILEHEHAEQCRFADMCTGSGAISAALSCNRPQWHGIATDCSITALRIAKKNCPKARVNMLCCDMFSAVKNLSGFRTPPAFDFIVCNPPYVSAEEMVHLDESVRLFEPPVALAGGIDGLDFYKVLAAFGKNVLKAGGRLYCEIGATQEEKVCALFADNGWSTIKCFPDLTNRARVVMASLSSKQYLRPQD